jgi:hypothetical protein
VYVVALDPGGTTGVAIVASANQPWKVEVTQLSGEHHNSLWNLLITLKPQHIVCESFENRGQSAAILESREYIGVVKLFSQQTHTPTSWQSASLGKGFWKDNKLQAHGLYAAGLKHARDATRHYLYWRSFKIKDYSLLESPSLGSVAPFRTPAK